MKTVLLVIGSLGVGGTENFMMNYYRNADKGRYEFYFYVSSGERLFYYDEIIALGGKIFIDKQSKTKFQRIMCFKQYISENPFDIIYYNSCSLTRMLVVAFCTKKNSFGKVIVHSHSSGTPHNNVVDKMWRWGAKKMLCNLIDYGFACSDLAGKAKYTNRFMKTYRYAVIKNAVDTAKFIYNEDDRIRGREKYNLVNRVVICNVGRISLEKNQMFLLKLMEHVNSLKLNYSLVIAGTGELEKDLKNYVRKKMGINSHVIFLGNVSDMQGVYSMADVLVMPSLYEGFPFVAIEAQINGLKCVFSNTISRMVDVSETSKFLDLNDDMEKWIEAISQLSLNRISESIKDNMIRQYDIKNEAKRIEVFFDSLF